MKKIISTILMLAMVMALGVTAFADSTNTITASGSSSSAQALYTAQAAAFSVTVPTTMPIEVWADGSNVYATNLMLFNNSNGQVKVTDVTVTGQNGWTLKDFGTDFSKIKVNTKEFGMKICGQAADAATGKIDVSKAFETLNGSSTYSIQYNANIAVQAKTYTDAHIANVVFTVGWDTAS